MTVSALDSPTTDPAEVSVVAGMFPGAVAGAATGAAAAAIGWLLVSGCALVAWFTVMALPVGSVLRFSTQFWLAAHGTGAAIGDRTITLIPLGLTAAQILVARSLASWVLRHHAGPVGVDGEGRARMLRTAATFVAGYTLVVALAALASGSSARLPQAVLGGVLVAAIGMLWALARLGSLAPVTLPGWLRRLPRAILAGLLGLAAVAAVALIVGVVLGLERIDRIDAAVGFDPVGAGLWLVVMLAYLPNLLAWAASFVLGAGFAVGVGSIVSPGLTQAGLLPAIPVLGAIPPNGPGSALAHAWLVAGVLGGVLAGLLQVRGERERALLPRLARAAAAGLGAAVVLLVVAVLSGGALGPGRLSFLGPRLLDLTWLATVPLVLAAVVAAAVEWFVAVRGRPAPPEADEETRTVVLDEERTALLGR